MERAARRVGRLTLSMRLELLHLALGARVTMDNKNPIFAVGLLDDVVDLRRASRHRPDSYKVGGQDERKIAGRPESDEERVL